MKLKRVAIVLTLIVVFGVHPDSLWSQALENAITGVVRDQGGGVVPGAKIIMTNTATNVSRVVTSDDQGNYVVPSLVVGEYTARAEHAGFKTELRTGISVQADKATRVDFKLAVGEVRQSVEVKATTAASIMRTEDAALGAVISQTQVQGLPLNGRDFLSLAQIVPGANSAEVGNQNTLARTQPLNLSVNGQRMFDDNYRLDGVSIIDAFVNGSTFIPSLEVLQEVSVQTGQYSTAYGEYSGAQVNMVTKSGTNRIHGSAFEFLQNSALDARAFFDVGETAPYRYNQFGVTIGGPVFFPKVYNGHDRTFFFFGYQGERTRQQTTEESADATALMRNGDFSQLLPTTVIRDPFTGAPFPNNIIPSSEIAPQAVKLMQYIPLPNLPGTGVNYVNTASAVNDDEQYFARVDQTISAKDTLFVRTANRTSNFQDVTINPNFRSLGSPSNQNYVLSETHIFSPRFVNQAEVSYVRQSVPTETGREGANINPLTDFGIAGITYSSPLVVGIPNASISGYLGTGENFANPRLLYSAPDVNDNATIELANQTLQFGAEFFRRREDFFSVDAANQGSFIFSGQLSGNAFGDFVLGLPYETEYQPELEISGIHQRHFSAYLQDNWRVTPRFTLNLGLRDEYAGSYSDVLGYARNFDWTTLSLFPAPGKVAPLNDPTNDYAPRFGLAYRASQRTVVRGGFGIYNTTPTEANVSLLDRNPPVNAEETLFTNLSDPNLTLADLQTGTATSGPQGLLTIPPDYGPGYAEQWSLNVQRQLPGGWVAELGYVGSHTLHLDNGYALNEPLTPGPGSVQSRRPIPEYADIRVFATDANSNYNALDARLQTANWHGLNLLTSYTWGKCLDMADDPATSTVGTAAQYPQNNYDRQAQWGRCTIDFTQQFHFAGVYAIRLGTRYTGIAGLIATGWSASVNGLLQSGDADTIIDSGNPANTGDATIFPNRLCNGNLPASQQTHLEFFNTSCFVSAGLYAYGNSSRGVIEGPATTLWDFSVLKTTRITESQNLEFRADFFNLFNDPHFGDPGLTLGAPGFGTITTAGPGRVIQFGLKYTF